MRPNLSMIAAGAAALLALPARAGFLDRLIDSAQDSAERAVEHNVDQKVDQGVNKAMSPDVSSPKKAKKAAPKQSAPAAEAADAAAGDAATAAPAKAPAAAAEADVADKPVEAYGNRYDFVPGDKVLVFDDLSDSDIGEYPARWSPKGGGGNPIEVVELKGGKRFMKSRFLAGAQDGEMQDGSITFLRYTAKGDMPEKFTVEFDCDIAGPVSVFFNERHGFGGSEVDVWSEDGKAQSLNVEGKLPVRKGLQHVAIAVSGTQLKLYVAGERVLSDPDAVERPVTRMGLQFLAPRAPNDHQMLTNFRLAEGGKDAKTMLVSGRIITHAITFDTGSDLLRPESGPMLRTIRDLLDADGSLRFRIEGHTDDQGSDKVNLPLSEKRAQAVRAWLIKEGIDGARLQAKGFGSGRPIDTAGTPESRANNRRVEFVKL